MMCESQFMRAVGRPKKKDTLPAVVEAATTKAPFPARLRRPSQKHPRGPLPNAGLKNLGNTCFLNATLQCLFGCSEFCAGFVERQYPLAAKSPAQGKIAMAFAELLGDIAQDKSIVSPSNLRKSLTKIAPQFRGNGQHDSQELLRCLLDGLAEDLKRPPPPSPVPAWVASLTRKLTPSAPPSGARSSPYSCASCSVRWGTPAPCSTLSARPSAVGRSTAQRAQQPDLGLGGYGHGQHEREYARQPRVRWRCRESACRGAFAFHGQDESDACCNM